MQIPRQVSPRIKAAIHALPVEWRVVKKRDHYFLYVDEQEVACIASNASKVNGFLVKRALEKLRKYRSLT